MTPEKARDLYYERYSEYMKSQHRQWDKPVIQDELSLRAWADVIDAIQSECDKDWAERYLALEASKKTIDWQFKNGYLSPSANSG